MNSAIELIEDSPFSSFDKYNLVLVALDLKPMTWVSISSLPWRNGDVPQEIDPSRLECAEHTVQAVSISYETESYVTDRGLWQSSEKRRRYQKVTNFFVANDAETLKKFMHGHASDDAQVIGEALGFPITAVDAFGTAEQMKFPELPVGLWFADAGHFLGFAPSRTHWRAEIEYVEACARAVEAASKIVYSAAKFTSNPLHGEEMLEHLVANYPDVAKY